MLIAVTGSNGFIGKALCKVLKKKDFKLRKIQRKKMKDTFQISNINQNTIWDDALDSVDVVIHCASIVHDFENIEFNYYDQINIKGTLNLFESCINAGVKKFIFLSTIKVNGEYTEQNLPFSINSKSFPKGNYALSKYKAEESLKEISKKAKIDLIIIRPPLVYGPGVKANFLNLIKITSMGIPLPFLGLKNKRSFIFIGNLVDIICDCIINPKAVGKTLLVADRKPIKIVYLFEVLYKEFGYKSRLFFLPSIFLNFIFFLLRRGNQFSTIKSSLEIDFEEFASIIDWKPLFSFEEGLKLTINWFKSKRLKL